MGISSIPIVYFITLADYGETLYSISLIEPFTVHSYWINNSSSYISAFITHGYWSRYLIAIISVTTIGLIIGIIRKIKSETEQKTEWGDNPFKMWGSWIGLLLSLFVLVFLVITEGGGDVIIIVPVFIIVPSIAFFIGWGIDLLIRRYKK